MSWGLLELLWEEGGHVRWFWRVLGLDLGPQVCELPYVSAQWARAPEVGSGGLQNLNWDFGTGFQGFVSSRGPTWVGSMRVERVLLELGLGSCVGQFRVWES